MKGLPFRRRLTVWSTLVAAVSIVICGAGAAWFVHEREVAEIDAELRAESAHLFTEMNNHGGVKFDWSKIENEMPEWLPLRNPPRFMELRTGAEVRWRSANLPAPGFGAETAGLRDFHLGKEGLRLLAVEQGGVTFVIAADLDQAMAMAGTLALALLAGLPLALAFAWFGGLRIAAGAANAEQPHLRHGRVPLRLEAGHRRRHQAHREAVRPTDPHSVVASPAAGNGSGVFALNAPIELPPDTIIVLMFFNTFRSPFN